MVVPTLTRSHTSLLGSAVIGVNPLTQVPVNTLWHYVLPIAVPDTFDTYTCVTAPTGFNFPNSGLQVR